MWSIATFSLIKCAPLFKWVYRVIIISPVTRVVQVSFSIMESNLVLAASLSSIGVIGMPSLRSTCLHVNHLRKASSLCFHKL
jgi:hypothetical protein